MAIVSISRIQVRRGQKNTGSGIPQLAGGELGWAVDTQELFIGNGSVSEGAPAVGNTKLITEHDNLFELSSQYIYRNGSIVQTGPLAESPIQRTLQQRLDDLVSVKAFGAEGSGVDETVELQRAIDQLFTSDGLTEILPTQRITLHIPAGEYLISNSLKLPPYTTLIGDGSRHTIITQTENYPVLETVNGLRTAGVNGDRSQTDNTNQAKHITVKGITLATSGDNTGLKIDCCVDSTFEDIKIIGDFDYLTPGATPYTNNYGIEFISLSTTVTCNNNIFKNIKIGSDEGVDEGFETSVYSDWDIRNNHFENCTFSYCRYGVRFGSGIVALGSPGKNSGPLNNSISKSEFKDIISHGVWIKYGRGNASTNNNFHNVGNDGATELDAVYSVIKLEDIENTSLDDYFDRTKKLSSESAYLTTAAYIPEIEGKIANSQNFSVSTNIGYSVGYVRTFRLPADSTKNYLVNYTYKSNLVNAVRHGTLELTINYDDSSVSLTDTYDFVGDVSYEDKVSFQATLSDINADSDIDTLLINVKDEILNDTATILFQVRTQS